MPITSSGLKRGRGMTLALHALGLIDIAIALALLGLGLSVGWPHIVLKGGENTVFIGYMTMAVCAQMALRTVALFIIARWTFRLTKNAHSRQAFPVSQRWAWLGYFTPIVSFWLPVQTIMALNLRLGRMQGWRRLIIGLWWGLRLLSCTSGAFLILMIYAFAVVALKWQRDGSFAMTANWLSWFVLAGLGAAIFQIIVVSLTYINQPKGDEVIQAGLF